MDLENFAPILGRSRDHKGHEHAQDGTLQPAFSLEDWRRIAHCFSHSTQSVNVAIVGKYVRFPDTYRSLIEALHHGGLPTCTKVNLSFIDAQDLESHEDLNTFAPLQNIHALVVPGGFGQRGIEGMIRAITYAKSRAIPFLGICLGMQLCIIESLRTYPGFELATSSEFLPESTPSGPSLDNLSANTLTSTPPCVVALMKEWMDNETLRLHSARMGGTMRLGAYRCILTPDTLIAGIYGSCSISERHRHRYEVNGLYLDAIEKSGLRISGLHGPLVECVENPQHPWFIGVQFHPEFKSRPFDPHPLFVSFVKSALTYERAEGRQGRTL